jgi:hypothetical protein
LRGIFFVANMALPMDWITDTIAIGTYVEARNRLVRVGAGIRSIICLDAAVGSGAAVGYSDRIH